MRLNTLHNLHFFLELMAGARGHRPPSLTRDAPENPGSTGLGLLPHPLEGNPCRIELVPESVSGDG